MKVLELSGAHIGKKIRVSWKLPRKNAKLHSYTGYVGNINHQIRNTTLLLFSKPNSTLYYDRVAFDVDIPYYADVEYIDD